MQGMCEKGMNYKEFLRSIVSEMEAIESGDGTELKISIVQENKNGVIRDGIRLFSEKDNCSLFYSLPQTETDEFEFEYTGERVARVAIHIMEAFFNNIENVRSATEMMQSLEDAQKALLPVLYSKETFEKMKIDCPHRYFFDLVICYQLFAERISARKGTVFVTNELAEDLAVNEENLFQKAMENMKQSTYVENLTEQLAEKKKCNHGCCMDDAAANVDIYIIKCNEKYGDGAMLNAQCLNELAKEFDTKRLVIIPCSLHECLVVDGKNINVSALRELIRYNNKTRVFEEDVLSYSVYYYDVKKGYGMYETRK